MSRRIVWTVALVLTAVVAALYLPVLGAPFEYDDKVEILQNRVLRTPGSFVPIWEYNPFRVLLLYSFSWDIWAWGVLRPAPYRFENVIIHAVCTLLLFAWLRRLVPHLAPSWGEERRALLTAGAALVFAVHPLAIESVTYISGRSSSLATLFVLLSLWAWMGYADRVTEDPAVGRWLAARVRRLNVGLGTVLGAGLLVGLPISWMVANERIASGRAIAIGLGGASALLAVAAAVGADRWKALTPAKVSAETQAAANKAANSLAVSFLAFLLGAVTKEIAAMLPVILFLVEWLAVQRGNGRAALDTLRGRLFPFVSIPVFLVVLRVGAYGYIASPTTIRPWFTNVLTQAEVVPHYLRLWLLPFPQSIYHDHAVVTGLGTWVTWLGFSGLVALLFVAARWRRLAPAAALGLWVAAIAFAPTSSIFALKETMVEHRTYLPSVGLALASGWVFAGPVWSLAAWMGRTRPLLHAALPLLLWCGGLIVGNFSYNQLWKSEEALWSNALSVNPDSPDAWRYLGDLYAGQGRWPDADAALSKALKLRPEDPELMSKLGRTKAINLDLPAAEALFRQAASVDACHTPALNNLAQILRLRGDLSNAIDLYTDSVGCAPTENYIAQRALGDIYYSELRDREKAGHHYTRALEVLDPASPDAPLLKQRLLELTW